MISEGFFGKKEDNMERAFFTNYNDFLALQNDPKRKIHTMDPLDDYISVTHKLLKEPVGRKSSVVIVSSLYGCAGL